MNPFKRVNIFTFLLVVSSFAFMLRLVNVASFSTPSSVAASATASQQFAPVPEQPLAPAKNAGVTPATATADPSPAAATTDAPAATTGDQAAAPPPMATEGDQNYSSAELGILQSLSKRRDELDKREQQISQREALLKAAGVEVDRKIAELNKIRSELEDLLGKQKTAEDARIESLVKIYENMKPKDAARIFDSLDMDVLLPVIGKMSDRKVSPVIAAMDPDKAREVTIKLEEQRKLPELPADSKKAAPAKATAPAASPPPIPTSP
jgi:flagellar motility protein MotE (MotC chaperone)